MPDRAAVRAERASTIACGSAAVEAPLPRSSGAPPPARASSYAQILRSSALIGGSSVVTVILSIIRAKGIALMLGPAGVGLVGLYSAVLELAQSVAAMGINSSGVRQIARAAASGDQGQVARTATTLRRTSIVLGLFGCTIFLLLSARLARWTFTSDAFALPMTVLSLGLLFRCVSDGQVALIQGMRRIGDLARIAVFSGIIGSAAGLLFVYFLRESGIVPMLLSVAAATLATSWWYRRKIAMPPVTVSASAARDETFALLTLGVAFMASAVLSTGSAYVIRAIIARASGLDAAGLYQASWALGGLYAAFILQAMGSDFYPRLTAVIDDHPECNRLVNEQTQMGLLIAGPGVIGTLALAPLVLGVFYSPKFVGAADALRWICLGMTLRVIAWPMGYIVLAKGARGIFFFTEIAAAVVHVGLAALLVGPLGVTGAAIAFCGLYLWHSALIYGIARRVTGFKWSPGSRQALAIMVPLIGLVFVAPAVLPNGLAMGVGLVGTLVGGAYSALTMRQLLPTDTVAQYAHSVMSALRLRGRA